MDLWRITIDSQQTGTKCEVYFTTDSSLADAGAITKYNPFPVGYVYISTVSTNPGTIFGGTWEQMTDTFLVAAGTTYTAGSTGGRSSNTLKAKVAPHTLKVNELPTHNHGMTGLALSSPNTSFFVLTTALWDGTALLGWGDFTEGGAFTHQIANYNDRNLKKNNRGWTLGVNDYGSPTTETGNNESHSHQMCLAVNKDTMKEETMKKKAVEIKKVVEIEETVKGTKM